MEPVQKWRWRSRLERRRIVEETSGASVSRVARAHDINANQIFQWRKLYREGLLEAEETPAALLPVKISSAVRKIHTGRESKTTASGVIDIDLGHARVRIEGSADADCVRAALGGLLR